MIFLKNSHYRFLIFRKSEFSVEFIKTSWILKKKMQIFLNFLVFSGRVMGGKHTYIEFISVGSLWPAWVGRGRVLLASK